MQGDGGRAVLVSGISSSAWDNVVGTRLMVFRDWAYDENTDGARFVGVVKQTGKVQEGGQGRMPLAAFRILKVC